jgi:dCMP deaminase
MTLTKNNRKNRIDWAMELAEVGSSMSEDPYQKVGAVALRPDNSVAAVCYNGAPPKIEIDWSDRDKRRPYTIHAEMNLVRYIKPNECDRVVITLSPCTDCLKNLASYGVKTVYFSKIYDKVDFSLIQNMAKAFQIELIQLNENA